MWSLDRASFLTCPLGCFKFHLFLPFRPLQELSIQLYAKIEEDTKGTEEEGVGKGSYQTACLHKVCLRHLVSVARYLPLCLREQSGCENERRLGRERLKLFFRPRPRSKSKNRWRWIECQVRNQVLFVSHFQEVVDRFGRYPQRNKVLGRENTPEEEEWLNNLPDKYKWWSIFRVLLNCIPNLVILFKNAESNSHVTLTPSTARCYYVSGHPTLLIFYFMYWTRSY